MGSFWKVREQGHSIWNWIVVFFVWVFRWFYLCVYLTKTLFSQSIEHVFFFQDLDFIDFCYNYTSFNKVIENNWSTKPLNWNSQHGMGVKAISNQNWLVKKFSLKWNTKPALKKNYPRILHIYHSMRTFEIEWEIWYFQKRAKSKTRPKLILINPHLNIIYMITIPIVTGGFQFFLESHKAQHTWPKKLNFCWERFLFVLILILVFVSFQFHPIFSIYFLVIESFFPLIWILFLFSHRPYLVQSIFMLCSEYAKNKFIHSLEMERKMSGRLLENYKI